MSPFSLECPQVAGISVRLEQAQIPLDNFVDTTPPINGKQKWLLSNALIHDSDVIMGAMPSRIFTQPFILAQIK